MAKTPGSSRDGRAPMRVAPLAIVLGSFVLLLALLPSAFAAAGDSAAEAIPIGGNGSFSGTAGPERSTWFTFQYPGGDQQLTISVEYLPADSSQTDLAIYTGSAQNVRKRSRDVTRTNNTLTLTFDDPSQETVFLEFINKHSDRSVSFVGTASPSSLVATPAPGTVTPTPGPVADSPQNALIVSSGGTFSGTIGPQRAVWYRFWYGNPGAEATVSVTLAPSADNTNLNLYVGEPDNLAQQDGEATRADDTLTRRINLPRAQYVYFSLANNGTSATLAYGGQVSPAFATPTPAVTSTPTATATATVVPTATPQPIATSTPAPRDARFFQETGFRIDNDAVWSYFSQRGGVATFGFPISRTFRFLGFQTQFFQRKVVQIGENGNARFMNVLDPDLLGFASSINFSPIPPFDNALVSSAPTVGSPNYDTAIIEFIRQHAPNTFQGKPVNFLETFQSTVTCQIAFPNQPCQENLLPGLNLEVWGSVISQPLVDPNNANFVFLRLQRGVMHFQGLDAAGRPIIGGTLLGLQFASLITGQDLPADLEQQARAANSPFLRQSCPGNPRGLCNPDQLPSTDLTMAFERQ